MNNRRYLILIKLALTIAVAGPLVQRAGADTVSTCIGFIPKLPCYNIELLMPPSIGSSDLEAFPLSGGLGGSDPRGLATPAAPPDPLGQSFAEGEAVLGLSSSSGANAVGDLQVNSPGSGARTASVTLDVARGDLLSVSLQLGCRSSIGVFGQGVCDFSNTAEITGIEQLDMSGNFLQDITLTDATGNVLGSTPAAVPEPSASMRCILAVSC